MLLVPQWQFFWLLVINIYHVGSEEFNSRLTKFYHNKACNNAGHRICPSKWEGGLVCDRRHCLYYDQMILSNSRDVKYASLLQNGSFHIELFPPSETVNRKGNNVSDRSHSTKIVEDVTDSHLTNTNNGMRGLPSIWDITVSTSNDNHCDINNETININDSLHGVCVNDYSNYINYYHFTVDFLVPLVSLLLDQQLVQLISNNNKINASHFTSSDITTEPWVSNKMKNYTVLFLAKYQLVIMKQRGWKQGVDWLTDLFRRKDGNTFYTAAINLLAHPDYPARALYFKDKDKLFRNEQNIVSSQNTNKIIQGFHQVKSSDKQEHMRFQTVSFGLPYIWQNISLVKDVDTQTHKNIVQDLNKKVNWTGDVNIDFNTMHTSKYLRRFAAFMYARTKEINSEQLVRHILTVKDVNAALIHRKNRRYATSLK